MRQKLAAVFGAVLLSFGGSDLSGQVGPATGSAAGYGLGAMTEARGGDAVLWNPALIGVLDGPYGSWSILSPYLEPSQASVARSLYDNRDALRGGTSRMLGESTRNTFRNWAGTSDVSSLAGRGAVHWASIHSGDIAVSLSSVLDVDVNLPSKGVLIAAGDPDAMDAPR